MKWHIAAIVERFLYQTPRGASASFSMKHSTKGRNATTSVVALLAILGVMVFVPVAYAAKSYTGAVSPSPTSWKSTIDVYVGIRNFGTVTVDSGDSVSSLTANVGYFGYGTGTVTIDGNNSTWTNASNLYLGYNYSTGILNINNGGAVTVGATTYVGGPWNGLGMISLQGGSFSTLSLYASPSQLTGTGTITTRGLVTDSNLVFDSTRGASQRVPGLGNVALNLNMSDFQNVGDLGAGWTDIGSVTIQDGLAINSAYGFLGCNAGSIGTATVNGDGSTWACSKDIRVGDGGTGTLNISGGGIVSNASGSIGNGYKSVGTVTVSGTNSQWINSNGLTVGNQGSGTLAITAGGSVYNGVGYVGVNSGSSGSVNVDGIGSTWTNDAELYLADHTQGSLKITNGGTVTDRICYMGFLDSAIADAIVDGPGSTWINSDGVYVGYGDGCKGTLNITNGGIVRTFHGSIGDRSSAMGTVTISGVGSSWTNSTANVYVGLSGTGTLNVLAGGKFTNHEQGMGTIIAKSSGSTGVATVDGPGSTWLEDDIIVIGSGGNGTLNITHGGVVKSSRIWLSYSGAGKLNITTGSILRTNDSYIGVQTGGNGNATVDGAGSLWSNRTLSFGYSGRLGGGTLNVTNGGMVTTSNVSLTTSQSLLSVDSQSMLAVQLNRTYSSPISGGTGTLKNDGVVRVMAGAGIAAGVYSPISASTWTGDGVYQTFGGTWNPTNHEFTVSTVQKSSSNTDIALDLTSRERVLVSDNATGWSLGAAFMPKDTLLHLTATAMDAKQMGDDNFAADTSILGRWLFTADEGYTRGEAVYLSFNVGIGHSVDDFGIWRYDGSSWASFAAPDLSYDGMYVSLTVTDLNGYAVTMVPEPSTQILLGVATIGLLSYNRRRRRRMA